MDMVENKRTLLGIESGPLAHSIKPHYTSILEYDIMQMQILQS
jgi:hypothetical protein